MKNNIIFKKNTDLPLVVVIGGGFAGINFVREVIGDPIEVLIIDKNNYHQFQPLLYQVAIGGLEPDAIVSPVRRLFDQHKNVRYRMAEVESVDSVKKIVKLDNGIVEYDYLVIATGSKTNYYGNAEIEANSIGLKNINDALKIRSWVLQNIEQASLVPACKKPALKFVIAGAGPAGVEMAGSLAEFKRFLLKKDYPDVNFDDFEIFLIEGDDKVLPTMSSKSQIHANKTLKKMGVNVILEARVLNFDGAVLTYSQDNETKTLETKTLIWTAGVSCNKINGIVEDNYAAGNRILVDEFLQVRNTPYIYAIGDIAAQISEDNPRGHPMVAQTAIQQGKYLAQNILNSNPAVFKYNDKGSMATIGMRDAVADIKTTFLNGRLGWLLWSFIHLISITNFKNRFRVAVSWMVKYFNYDKANQLIIRKYKMK